MDSLDILKKRLTVRGGDAEGRLVQSKLDTLKQALKYSYQAETILFNEVEHRALLNSNKLKPDYDDKIISIPFESEFKVGSVFYWDRTKSHWIVYMRQWSEDAYFRGYARRAEHIMKWIDSLGQEKSEYVAVRGPVETKIVEGMKSDIAFDTPNYTLSIVVPNTEDTIKLKRYSKVTIDGQDWEITVADAMNEEGVIELNLKELIKNGEDGDIVGDGNKPKIRLETNLDDTEDIKVGEPFNLVSIIYVNDQINFNLTHLVQYEVVSGNAEIIEGKLIISEEGVVEVGLTLKEAGIENIYTFNGVMEAPEGDELFEIIGDLETKAYGGEVYEIRKSIGGVKVPANGNWKVVEDKRLFTVLHADKDKISLAWRSGIVGIVNLAYEENGELKTEVQIKLTSLM